MRKNLLAIGIFIFSWECLFFFAEPPRYLVPTVYDVFLSFSESYKILFESFLMTAKESLGGILLGAFFGIIISAVFFYSAFARIYIFPYVLAFDAMPKLAFGPYIVLLVGTGIESKVVISALVCFFPFVINVTGSLMRLDVNLRDYIRVIGATEWRVFFSVRIPDAFSSIHQSLRIAIPLSVLGSIIGEFISSENGLGYLLMFSVGQLDPGLNACTLLMIAVLVWLMYMFLWIFCLIMQSRGFGRD